MQEMIIYAFGKGIEEMQEIIVYYFLGLLYLVPAIVAQRRKHNNIVPILITNLILAWTVIGWFICLIWATTNNTKA